MLHHIHLRAYLPLLLLSTIPTMIQAGEPNERGSSQVPDRIPLIEDEPEKTSASSPIIQVKVESSQANGVGAFNAMLKSARTEYAQVNDYTAMLIRQERVLGKLLPTQVVELRFRKMPLSINTRIVEPKELCGEETNFNSDKSSHKVKFKQADVAQQFYWDVNLDDPKVLTHTRHPITEVGIDAMLDRVEAIVQNEQMLNHSVGIYVSDSMYDGAACQRYEIITPAAHPGRYAYRILLFINKATKLPVRYESYSKPDVATTEADSLLETQSLVNLKTNVRLGNGTFQR